MFQPQTYLLALGFMLISMLCWGSWANTVKLSPGYRFQLFYWDYVIGLLAGALFWGATLGSLGSTGRSFLDDIVAADRLHVLWALLGGVIFNIANLLLVAAIDIAGLAVAFPVGIGVALVVGAVSSYVLLPSGNPWLLFVGIALVVAAILFDAAAYRMREREHLAMSRRGVVISLVSGVLMGSFYPFVSKAMTGTHAPGPYATSFFFAFGVALCAIPVNLLLMAHPLDGREPVAMRGYWKAKTSWHAAGIAGGIIWCTGAVLNFSASRSHVVGPAVSYSIGQGATMISACWGVFIWHEFASASSTAKRYLICMFVLFALGLTSVAVSPLF